MNSFFSLRNIEEYWHNSNSPFILFPNFSISFAEYKLNLNHLVQKLSRKTEEDWLLYCEEPGFFLLAFFALLYSGKNIHLPGNLPKQEQTLPVLSDNPKKSILELRYKPLKDLKDLPALNEIQNEKQKIVLYTSGSTGKAKKEVKKSAQIENEIKNLAVLWGKDLSPIPFYSTVSHQHFYGLLFSILLPYYCGSPIGGTRIQYPENFGIIESEKLALVSSPAFLKRLEDSQVLLKDRNCFNVVFSSGGFLPQNHATYCQSFFKCTLQEIYGSTETGGIGWKNPVEDECWTPFPGIILKSDENRILLNSPYLPKDTNFILEDKIEIKKNGLFELLGREDSIVKIEEKRIALNELSNRLQESPFVHDSVMIKLEGRRQYIGAVVELNHNGKEHLSTYGKKEMNRLLRNHLLIFFPATVVPKKWRYMDRIPVNSQGKISTKELEALFLPQWLDEPVIEEEMQISDGWKYIINFPQNYRYFDGHFPEMKILPAVVQTHWVMKQCQKKIKDLPPINSIPRMKFMNPVFPERPIVVEIKVIKEQGKINFTYKESGSGNLCSKGTIQFKEQITE